MELKQSDLAELDQIVELYRDTFTASEGPDEGGMIADLSKNLMTTTQPSDIYVFTAVDQGVIVGAIIFTRLRYDGSDQSVFVLGLSLFTAKNSQKALDQRSFGMAWMSCSVTVLVLRQPMVTRIITRGLGSFRRPKMTCPHPLAFNTLRGGWCNHCRDRIFQT